MAQDFIDRAKVVYLDQYREVAVFAEAAAAWFAANPDHYSFSDLEIMTDGLALRWGAHDRAVMVVKIDSGFSPLIFADAVKEKKDSSFIVTVGDMAKACEVISRCGVSIGDLKP